MKDRNDYGARQGFGLRKIRSSPNGYGTDACNPNPEILIHGSISQSWLRTIHETKTTGAKRYFALFSPFGRGFLVLIPPPHSPLTFPHSTFACVKTYIHVFTILTLESKDPKVIQEQTIRDAKTNLILDAARKIFSEKGYHEARLEDIATAAGFSKASLYNYYSDKEQIFLSLATRDFEELLIRLRKGIENSGQLLPSIESLLRTVFSFFGEQVSFFWTVTNYQTSGCRNLELPQNHKELVGRFHDYYEGILDMFAGVLRAARERNEFSSKIDEMVLARYIAGLVRGIVFEWKVSGRIGDTEKTVQDLLAFIADGLACRRIPPQPGHDAATC